MAMRMRRTLRVTWAPILSSLSRMAHPPGHAQTDFGEATAIIGGVAHKAHFFVIDLPHSDACFVRAYPSATAEAWVVGHVHAFAFFGKLPVSVLYDNDRCLVSKILRSRSTMGDQHGDVGGVGRCRVRV